MIAMDGLIRSLTMADKPRAYTEEEARAMFLEKVYEIKEFWEKESRKETLKEKMEGCIFSIMALLDGSHIGFPAVSLLLDPHSGDKDYHKEQGENWFEPEMEIGDLVELHDEWQKLRAEKDEA